MLLSYSKVKRGLGFSVWVNKKKTQTNRCGSFSLKITKKISAQPLKLTVLPSEVPGSVYLHAKSFIGKKCSLIWIHTAAFILRIAVPSDAILVSQGRSTRSRHIVLLPFFNLYNFLSKQLLSNTLIVTSFFLATLGRSLRFTLVGYNYTCYYEENVVFFNLGYSHVSSVNLPPGVFIRIINKRSIYLYGSNEVNLQWTASRMLALKSPSVFTGKGLLKGTGSFKVKKRAGQ